MFASSSAPRSSPVTASETRYLRPRRQSKGQSARIFTSRIDLSSCSMAAAQLRHPTLSLQSSITCYAWPEVLARSNHLNQSDSRYNEQALLLQALDRDLSETLYCFVCNKRHVLRRRHEDRLGAEEMYRRVSESRCQRGDGTYNYGTTDTYHAGFRFEHVQMTMN